MDSIKALMSPRSYKAYIHVLEARNIASPDDTPLHFQITLGPHTLKGGKYNTFKNVLQVYEKFGLDICMPGPAVVQIQLFWGDNCLGSSKIDMEDRYFTSNWRKLTLKPIEVRNLKGSYNKSVGQVKIWLELEEQGNPGIAESKAQPANEVSLLERPMRIDFELRCIIYETREVELKDRLEKCNDLYVRGFPGTLPYQDTDTHWRCRDKGSFNWRMKFPLSFPMRGE